MFLLILFLIVCLVMPIKDESNYTVACGPATNGVDHCIKVDRVFSCGERKHKENIGMEIFSVCKVHKL